MSVLAVTASHGCSPTRDQAGLPGGMSVRCLPDDRVETRYDGQAPPRRREAASVFSATVKPGAGHAVAKPPARAARRVDLSPRPLDRRGRSARPSPPGAAPWSATSRLGTRGTRSTIRLSWSSSRAAVVTGSPCRSRRSHRPPCGAVRAGSTVRSCRCGGTRGAVSRTTCGGRTAGDDGRGSWRSSRSEPASDWPNEQTSPCCNWTPRPGWHHHSRCSVGASGSHFVQL